MYSICVSILAKLKILISFVKNSLNAKCLLTMLTYLSIFIVVMTLLHPIYKLVISLVSRLIGKKNDKSSSHRKYKKIDSDSCSACDSSSRHSSSSSSSSRHSSSSSSDNKLKKKNKKNECKVKLNKNKINKTLRNFKLD